ncbi:MAG: glycerol-3-phosphate 1-O-acyltransferase PlsY [Ilumatobacteraceae bacterium]
MIWLLLVPAYLLGTFPSAVIVARSKGIDIHEVGSGNPGASNIARTMGTKWGVLVFLLDGLKGAIPTAVALLFTDRPSPAAYGAAAAAVVGHMYPVTRRFKGGKGVATLGGATVVLQPLLFAILTVVWVAVRKATGKASLASLQLTVGLPLGIALLGGPGWEVATAVGLGVLVLLRHLDNIKRLLGGKELSASRGE